MGRKLTTISDFAQHRGISESAVRRAIKRGRLRSSIVTTPRGTKICDVELADREWDANTDHTHTPAAVLAQLGVVSSEAAIEEKFWRTRLLALDYRRRAALLVEAAAVEARLANVFASCRTRLLALSDRARQRLPKLTAADAKVLDALVREALVPLEEGGRHGEK